MTLSAAHACRRHADRAHTRSLAGEPIVHLILDGTVVRVRLDRKATSIRCSRSQSRACAARAPGLAHCPERSHHARAAAVRVLHRRWRAGARQGHRIHLRRRADPALQTLAPKSIDQPIDLAA